MTIKQPKAPKVLKELTQPNELNRLNKPNKLNNSISCRFLLTLACMVYTICIRRYQMLYIESLQIDDHVLDKIETKHHISFAEVEEACLFRGRHVRRGREGLYKVFSRTVAGRYILVVLAYLGRGNWRVVTARDMTDKERRLYISVTGGR